MPLRPRIRWVRQADRDQVSELYRLSMIEEGLDFDARAFARTWRAALSQHAPFRIVVAEQAGELIGLLSVHPYQSTYFGQQALLVEDVVVRPSSRRKGIGKAMLGFVERHGRGMGALRLELHVRENNPARRLYERMGFVAQPYAWMKKAL